MFLREWQNFILSPVALQSTETRKDFKDPNDLINPNLVGNILDKSNMVCHGWSGFKVGHNLVMIIFTI